MERAFLKYCIILTFSGTSINEGAQKLLRGYPGGSNGNFIFGVEFLRSHDRG